MTGPYLDELITFQLPIEVGTAQDGGRLIPRSVVEDSNEQRDVVMKMSVTGTVDNAVLPAWRNTLIDSVIST